MEKNLKNNRYIYMYNWISLLFIWKYHNIINQLYSQFKNCLKKQRLSVLCWTICCPICISSVWFTSVTQFCPTLCDPMNCSTPGPHVHHQLPEFPQTHVHRVSDAIQPFHPLSSPSPPAPNLSQHQGLFQWLNFSHEVPKVLEFQL